MLDLISNYFEKNFHSELFLQTVSLPHEEKAANSLFIRQEMDKYLKQKFNSSDSELMDIVNVPQGLTIGDKKLFASISHTGKKAIYCICDNPVGIDIEDASRLNPKVIQRITTPPELSLIPDSNILWSIKESAFKAIPFIIQPKVITDIEIKKIDPIELPSSEKVFSYKFLAKVKSPDEMSIVGIVVNTASNQLAVSTILKQ